METTKPADDIFPVGEAWIELIYGKIRQGKTYMATVLILRRLREGNVVYTSYPVEFDGYDERKIWWCRLFGFFGLKKHFLVVPKENLHVFNFFDMTSSEFFDYFSSKTDCIFVVDEAQWPFDSYIGTHLEKDHRISIFATGHFNRALILVTQRPMQIHTSLRGNIARFWKMEKTFDGWWFFPPRFQITEFQDVKTDGVPDETREQLRDEDTGEISEGEYLYAESQESFALDRKLAKSYNSKYLRGNMIPSQENLAYQILRPWADNIKMLFQKKRLKVEVENK